MTAVEREITAGTDVNQRSKSGVTALMLASSRGYPDIVRALLAAAADVNAASNGFTALHSAAYRGHQSIVHELVSAGARIDARTDKGYLETTPLHGAASAGQLNTVKILVDAGADVNAKDELGFTPLMLAAAGGWIDMVSFLLKHGAKAGIALHDGTTAAGIAEMNRHHEVAALLRSKALLPE